MSFGGNKDQGGTRHDSVGDTLHQQEEESGRELVSFRRRVRIEALHTTQAHNTTQMSDELRGLEEQSTSVFSAKVMKQV